MNGTDAPNERVMPVVSYQKVRSCPTELFLPELALYDGFDHFGG